jgi:formylglycine-generating enzyme
MKTRFTALTMACCALGLGAVTTAHAALDTPNDRMSTITNGWFIMGDSNDGNSAGNAPKHKVFVNGFQMDVNLITLSNWKLVYDWAAANSYDFSTGAAFSGANQPVQGINWHDAVKWCNARSQRDGLKPCYYTDAGKRQIYTSGIISNLTSACVDWTANGYRLPTEAEWEYAARGGTNGQRFPWGMTISHSQATYKSPGALILSWDLGPAFVIPSASSAVGSHRSANGYGLNDMAGDLGEWCWDGYSSIYYISSPTNNPVGPNVSSTRTVRGGNWSEFADALRCSYRESHLALSGANYIGFRCVCSTNGGGGGSTGTQPQSIWFTDGNTVLQPGSNLQPGSSLFALATSGQTVNLTISNSVGSVGGNGTNVTIGTPQITVTAKVNGNADFVSATSNATFTVITSSPQPSLVVANGRIAAASLSQVLGSPTNIVDQQGLNTVLSHYWLQSPPWITNTTFPGGTNFCFSITNFAFTVQYSTNLTSWRNLDGRARISFDDTNTPAGPNRYYRLVGSTNY